MAIMKTNGNLIEISCNGMNGWDFTVETTTTPRYLTTYNGYPLGAHSIGKRLYKLIGKFGPANLDDEMPTELYSIDTEVEFDEGGTILFIELVSSSMEWKRYGK
jgi:hypothetical protein